MLNLTLTIPPRKEREVAIQCLQVMSQDEWEQLVGFALSVVVLQESVAAQKEYWVAPREPA